MEPPSFLGFTEGILLCPRTLNPKTLNPKPLIKDSLSLKEDGPGELVDFVAAYMKDFVETGRR